MVPYVIPHEWNRLTLLWLIALFAMTFVGNGTLPMPISAYILWLGQFHMPLWVVLIGTLGTVLGWLFLGDRFARTMPEFAKTKIKNCVPTWMESLFLSQPRVAIFWVNVLFPWDPLRPLAVMYGHSPQSLAPPMIAGRIIRYGLLVTLGGMISQFRFLFWALVVGLVLSLIARFLPQPSFLKFPFRQSSVD